MAESVSFSSTMRLTGNNTGIEVPADVVERLGGGKRPAVAVTVNGYEYRSTIGVMGGRYLIPFSSDKRAETGIAGNDPIQVSLVLDTAPREVPVPPDLAAALQSAGAMEAFERLAPSHRKAHITAIESAKAPETRARRVEAAIAKITG